MNLWCNDVVSAKGTRENGIIGVTLHHCTIQQVHVVCIWVKLSLEGYSDNLCVTHHALRRQVCLWVFHYGGNEILGTFGADVVSLSALDPRVVTHQFGPAPSDT